MIVLLLSCSSTDWCVRLNLDCEIDEVRPEVDDVDGDVWPDQEDCDPYNPAVYPQAIEICDGIDNDCDGELDEGVSTLYYRDGDGDGFAAEDETTRICFGLPKPSGWIEDPEQWDCDDDAFGTYPGASESCDEADNDCDGEIDEGVTAFFYYDADMDGYGDPAVFIEGCFAASGYTGDDTDCDDAESTIYPGAAEACEVGGDPIDADCDGFVDDCITSLGDARWYGEDEFLAGWAVSGAGDIDGDGLGDVLVGAHGWSSDAGVVSGAAYLVTGLTSGALSDVGIVLAGASGSDYTGHSLDAVGDLDADGYDDVIIGAHKGGERGEGLAWLVMGPITASAGLDEIGVPLLGSDPAEGAGFSVAGLDAQHVLVSAPYSDASGVDGGRVYVASPGSEGGELSAISAVFADDGGGFAGWSVDAAGDTDGDGIDEFIVGAPSHSSGSGVAWLVPQGDGGLLGEQALFTLAGGVNNVAGCSVAGAGDVDGDGLDDVLIGAYGEGSGGTGAGAAALIPGGFIADKTGEVLSFSAAPVRLLGDTGDFAGYAVGSAGDVDGDGRAEVLVGAQRSDLGGTDVGVTWLVRQPAEGTWDLSDMAWGLSGSEQARSGWSVASAGDVDGDALGDLLIGAPYADTGASDGGAVWLTSAALLP